MSEELEKTDGETPEEQGNEGGSLYYWLQALVVALVVLILVFTFLGRIVSVIGHSMDNTLNNGEILLLQSVGYTPRQGDIIVLNKAAGVPVHPGPGHFSDTLGNFLLYYYDSKGDPSDLHPVHRLDRGTTGLLAAAKHPHAQEVLKNQLHTADFRRTYLAVCEGVPQPAEGVIDVPMGPKPGSLMEQQVRPDGKPARTRYRVLSVRGGRALVQLELDTGRTHQIRVHMAHIGHPLTGDFLYGTEDRALIPRPALHSARLTLRQPITGQVLSFTVPLPEDMQRLL